MKKLFFLAILIFLLTGCLKKEKIENQEPSIFKKAIDGAHQIETNNDEKNKNEKQLLY